MTFSYDRSTIFFSVVFSHNKSLSSFCVGAFPFIFNGVVGSTENPFLSSNLHMWKKRIDASPWIS